MTVFIPPVPFEELAETFKNSSLIRLLLCTSVAGAYSIYHER